MNNPRLAGVALVAMAGALLWLSQSQEVPPQPQPAPAPSPAPAPNPPCPPKPKPRSPWGSWEAAVGGPRHEDGTEISCELPGSLHLKNCGGSDGAGLCVFTSIAHSARWQNVRLLQDFRDWMRKHPGGGYPSKVDKMIAQCASERGQPVPDYLQVESSDLEILKAACRSGRMPGVTYSRSPTGRYGGQQISHMVSLVHADDAHFVILDNNYPGPDKYEWLTPDEFKRTYAGNGQGWAVVLLSGPPPAPPHN